MMGQPRLSLLVYKIQREGTKPFVFDFGELGLAFDVARSLRRALEAEMGHTTIETQSKAFMALRKLSQCLGELGVKELSPLPQDVLQCFADWLHKTPLGPSAQVSLTKVRQLLAWCERNTPRILAKDINLVVSKIRHLRFEPAKEGLPQTEIKAVLHACYEDIERIEKERAQIRMILAGEIDSPKKREYVLLIHDLMEAGNGQLALQPIYHRAGKSLSRRVDDFGGSRRIAKLTYLSPQDLLPFLVAIIAQTGGNPESIRFTKADCIVAHPIRNDIERVVWQKGRSSREQFADFPKNKEWTAPDLIRRLNMLTSELRLKAAHNSREKLFICYHWHSRTICALEKGGMLDELRKFIARHSLPSFQLRDLRRSLSQIVQAVQGKARDAQMQLNHESPATTQRYTVTQSIADQDDQIIHAHQVQFVSLAKDRYRASSSAKTTPLEFDIPSGGMETTFGFRCKDPLAGIAPGSTRGSMCLQFFGCAGCPGAFIPLDDVDVVARLLSSAQALDEAKARSQIEGWWKRFEAIYEPTRRLIEEALLPLVDHSILERARPLATPLLIPRLE